MIIDVGGRRILFDCEVGRSTLFGQVGGRLLTNMKAAGIKWASIDAIMLSHAHPEHIGGLMNDAGESNFRNAYLYLSQADFDCRTSGERAGSSLATLHRFCQQQLLLNRDRLHFMLDRQEVLTEIRVAPGHTIGHMHFLLASGSQTLAFMADLSRHHSLGSNGDGRSMGTTT